MNRGSTASLTLAFLLPLMAACLEEGTSYAQAFEPVEAPAWSPGHTWTYEIQSRYESVRTLGDSTESSEYSNADHVTLTVTNASAPIDGEPAYYVQVSPPQYLPLFARGQLQAVSAKDLSLLAFSDNYHVAYAESPEYYVDDHAMPPIDCDPSVVLQRTEETFSLLSFPLDAKKKWTGDVDGQDLMSGFGGQMEASVQGLHEVSTGAGFFQAVHVVALLSDPTASSYGPSGTGHLRVEADYSAEVEQVARLEITRSNRGYEGHETTTQILTLESYALEQVPPEPAPAVRDPAQPMPSTSWRIVTDRPAPFNAADGPVTARFTIVEQEPDCCYSYDGSIESVTEFPQQPQVDPAQYGIVWRIWGGPGEEEIFEGPVLEYTFTTPAMYQINAEIRPTKCDGYWTSGAYGALPVDWVSLSHIDPPEGTRKVVDVLEVPIGAYGAPAVISASTPAVTDPGRLILVDPLGRRYEFGQPGYANDFYFDIPGTWKLQWDTGTLSLGDEADIQLAIVHSGHY